MTEPFIEYEGRKYTPLEFAELMSQKLPEKYKAVVEGQVRILKSADESVKNYDKLIASMEKHDPGNYLTQRRNDREQAIRWKVQQEKFLELLLSLDEYTHAMAAAAKKEVDDLK
jgi:hypothetical protein